VRYFVTGATGFIGGRLVRQLVERDHRVVTIVRDPSKAADLTALGVEVHPGDITQRDSMRAPMNGADGVFHVAGWYKLGARDTRQARAVNVDGTRQVLELMAELEIPRGVYTSTLAVFSDTHGRVPDESYRFRGRHLTTYDRTKWEAHYEVAEPMIKAGLPLMIVLPGLTYGPGDTSLVHQMLVDYLRLRLRATPRGTAYCWAYVDDIAYGHILAMERGTPGESYIIGGDVHTLIDALAIAQKITGIAAPRIHPPGALLRAAAPFAAFLGRFVPLPETYSADALRSYAGVTYLGSNAKARRELGFGVTPLEEGLRETLSWEMNRLGMPLPPWMREVSLPT